MCTWQNMKSSPVTAPIARKIEAHPMFKFIKVSTLIREWRLGTASQGDSPTARNIADLHRLQALLDRMLES